MASEKLDDVDVVGKRLPPASVDDMILWVLRGYTDLVYDLNKRELLMQGMVISWVQHRSEFGLRTLDNRSILAYPRPAENKRIINAIVKKREE